MRKDYEVRNKKMGGGMAKKRTMMKNGGLKMWAGVLSGVAKIKEELAKIHIFAFYTVRNRYSNNLCYVMAFILKL